MEAALALVVFNVVFTGAAFNALVVLSVLAVRARSLALGVAVAAVAHLSFRALLHALVASLESIVIALRVPLISPNLASSRTYFLARRARLLKTLRLFPAFFFKSPTELILF